LIDSRSPTRLRSPVVISVPHAGLEYPASRANLGRLPRESFLRDVDYEIHLMWENAAKSFELPFVRSRVHRYAIDLNRAEDQYSRLSVEGAGEPGAEPQKTLFWYESTRGEKLLERPLKPEEARALLDAVWRPYRAWIERELARAKRQFGFAILIDGHSMPSLGTGFHADPGRRRADIVPGDCHGRACARAILEASREAAEALGLSYRPNDPYSGGGITQAFGRPAEGLHALQIEANRGVYMNEATWELDRGGLAKLQAFADALVSRLVGLRL